MNTMLRCTWRPSTMTTMAPSLFAGRTTVGAQGDILSLSKRFASYSANQGRAKLKKNLKAKAKFETKPATAKKPLSEAFKRFNKRPPIAMPQIRPASELLTDYLPDDATIRLAVGRVRMANRRPLYKSDVNREVNALLSLPDRKVQFLGDLRKVPEEQITGLKLPNWLKQGLIGLAKATPVQKTTSQ